MLGGCGADEVDAAADGGARPDDWRADAGDFLAMLKPPGSTPETSRGFVDMIRVERFCVD